MIAKPMIAKRLLRHEWILGFLCWLGALYIRLVHATGRWRVENGEIPQGLWNAGTPFILCFWHGRLLMMPYCWPKGVPIDTLISHHPDGQILARTVGHFAIGSIAGSTSRGGSAALRALVRTLKDGRSIGITPDGPRGPRMRAGGGIVNLARLAQAPIVPVAYGVTTGSVLKSWDRFVLAAPFSRGVFVWGQPVAVAADASGEALEAARHEVEARLNQITARADELCGRPAIAPAPPAQGEAQGEAEAAASGAEGR